MRLQGKVAIVTGGAQGIGRAYVERFAKEGAAVAIVDLREQEGNALARMIADTGGRAIAVKADITSEDEMAAATKRIAAELGGIDIVVNNAALYGDMDFTDQSIAYLRRIFEVNIIGIVVVSRAAFPYLKQRGGGSIINIASTAAFPLPSRAPVGDLPTIPLSGYGISKAAVVYMSQSMARQLGGQGIRVNTIAPGVTMSDATRKVVPGPLVEQLTGLTALQSTLEPSDLAGTAVFLASDDSKMMTGQCLVVDAGLVMLG